MTKTVTKRTCAHCKARFRPTGKGRPPRYCSASCRQRAYEQRRIARLVEQQLPVRLLEADMGDMRLRALVREEVEKVLGPAPSATRSRPSKREAKPNLRLIKGEDGGEQGET